MRLHWSPTSPFVRKVMVVAHEHGLQDRIERVRSVVAMSAPNPDVMRDNPLNKLPTLVLADGLAVFDSRVICEYLDDIGTGPKLTPTAGPARLLCQARHALGDGLLDLLILFRNERARPAERQSEPHLTAFLAKTIATFDRLEALAGDWPADAIDLGYISIGCGLAYSDYRFADLDWRAGRPTLAAWQAIFEQRPSMRATVIPE